MDNNFGWNLGGDFIAHYGTKRHSGRYPWGSGAKNGKTPIHEHDEKKHKHSSSSRVDKSSAKRGNSEEDADTKARKAAQAAGLDQGDNWKMYRMAQAGDKKAQQVISEWEKGKSEQRQRLQSTVDEDLKIPQLYKKSLFGKMQFDQKAFDEFTNKVEDKTKAYYELMDKKALNERKQLNKELLQTDDVKDFEKWSDLDNKTYELMIEDYNKVTQNKFDAGKSSYNATADDSAYAAFLSQYYRIMDEEIQHSDFDHRDYLRRRKITRILTTPI